MNNNNNNNNTKNNKHNKHNKRKNPSPNIFNMLKLFSRRIIRSAFVWHRIHVVRLRRDSGTHIVRIRDGVGQWRITRWTNKHTIALWRCTTVVRLLYDPIIVVCRSCYGRTYLMPVARLPCGTFTIICNDPRCLVTHTHNTLVLLLAKDNRVIYQWRVHDRSTVCLGRVNDELLTWVCIVKPSRQTYCNVTGSVQHRVTVWTVFSL